MTENIGSAPHGSERAQPRAIHVLQLQQIGINAVSAFHVQHDGKRPRTSDCIYSIDVRRDADFVVGTCLQLLQCSELLSDFTSRVSCIQRLSQSPS